MALSFNGLEPVAFGGRDCVPKIDTETKLRIQAIKAYDSTSDEVLASAFPNDEAYVRDFLANKMTVYEKELLHAYLLGGEHMVRLLVGKVENIDVSKAVKEVEVKNGE